MLSGRLRSAVFRWKRTVWSSTFSSAPLLIVVFLTGLPSLSFLPVSTVVVIEAKRPIFDEPVFGSSQRVILAITSSAPKSSQFDHFTPLRRWTLQVFRSLIGRASV